MRLFSLTEANRNMHEILKTESCVHCLIFLIDMAGYSTRAFLLEDFNPLRYLFSFINCSTMRYYLFMKKHKYNM